MNTRIFSVLALCLLGCFAVRDPAQEKPAQEKPEVAGIRALELKWVDAYKRRQIAAVAALLAEDYVITLEDGSTYGKVGFISYSAGPLRVDVADLADVKIRMHENIAVVTAAYHERGEFSGKSYDYHDRLTDVWMKTAGRWQLIASHYSVAKGL
jgi:ketosteroid isomerase-like protein